MPQGRPPRRVTLLCGAIVPGGRGGQHSWRRPLRRASVVPRRVGSIRTLCEHCSWNVVLGTRSMAARGDIDAERRRRKEEIRREFELARRVSAASPGLLREFILRQHVTSVRGLLQDLRSFRAKYARTVHVVARPHVRARSRRRVVRASPRRANAPPSSEPSPSPSPAPGRPL
jgi:hypothetical protein